MTFVDVSNYLEEDIVRLKVIVIDTVVSQKPDSQSYPAEKNELCL
jgi:hypothetical protein